MANFKDSVFTFCGVLLRSSFIMRVGLPVGLAISCIVQARVEPPLAVVNGTFLPGGEYSDEGPAQAAQYGFPQAIRLESLQLLSVSKSPLLIVDGSFPGVLIPLRVENSSVLNRKKASYSLVQSDWQEDKVCGRRERRSIELWFYWNSATGWIDTNSIRIQATYTEWKNACIDEPTALSKVDYLFQD